MAKQSGLGSALWVGSADLSGDAGSIDTIETARGVLDVTPINAAAQERILGLGDGTIGFTAFWNVSAGQAHPILSALPRTDIQVTAAMGTPALGSHAASLIAKQTTYAPNRGADGSLVVTTSAVGAAGSPVEWGELLTVGKESFATGTVDGASIDFGSASSLFGAAGYLHVFSVASGTATFAIQDSANNTDFTDITGLVFTGATGATTERLQTAAGATIRRYVRIEGRGVHGAAVVAVNFVRYAA